MKFAVWKVSLGLLHNVSCWVVDYFGFNFDILRPIGATRYTDGAEIWRGAVNSITPNLTIFGAEVECGAQKTQNSTQFWAIFTKYWSFAGSFMFGNVQ